MLSSASTKVFRMTDHISSLVLKSQSIKRYGALALPRGQGAIRLALENKQARPLLLWSFALGGTQSQPNTAPATEHCSTQTCTYTYTFTFTYTYTCYLGFYIRYPHILFVAISMLASLDTHTNVAMCIYRRSLSCLALVMFVSGCARTDTRARALLVSLYTYTLSVATFIISALLHTGKSLHSLSWS